MRFTLPVSVLLIALPFGAALYLGLSAEPSRADPPDRTSSSSAAKGTQTGGPAQDRPVDYTAEDRKAMIALSERARAALPAVLKRFQKGLGPGQQLYVTVVLKEPGSKMEQIFANVLSWDASTGLINATISNDVQLLKTHHRGEVLSIAQPDVMDWTIALPDGREEGNLIGKYIDSQHGGVQPEPPPIPIGTWIVLSHPTQGTFLLFTYFDKMAGLSGKGGKLTDANSPASAQGAAEKPSLTFRLPMPGFVPAELDQALKQKLHLPQKPGWMKYYE